MRQIINITLLILLSGWLTAYQPAEYSDSFSLQTDGVNATQSDLSGNGDTTQHNPVPFLPATLAETGHESIQEIEPDTNVQLSKLSVSTFLTLSSQHLLYSERTIRFDSVRKLLFPFHTYL